MTEVEKLCELAGLPCELFVDIIVGRSLKGYFFEPEKQLNLIEFISTKCSIQICKDDEYFITFDFGEGYTMETDESFAEALAKTIVSSWRKFTKEEQEQIKEILK